MVRLREHDLLKVSPTLPSPAIFESKDRAGRNQDIKQTRLASTLALIILNFIIKGGGGG
jgi:hypothetical protein